MTITIRNKDYKLKDNCNYASFAFREARGYEIYEMKSSNDAQIYFWLYLKGSNKETFDISLDEFIFDILDEQPQILEQFNYFLLSKKK